jgi:putative transposase
VVEGVRLHLQHAAATEGFAIIAYCFMPDHLHLLVEGLKESSDLRRFVSSFNQRSGDAYHRGTGQCLWQTGYYDHVLRDEQSLQATAGYILQNPVRAGLVERMEQYPHMGSDRWEFRDLMQAVAPRQNDG